MRGIGAGREEEDALNARIVELEAEVERLRADYESLRATRDWLGSEWQAEVERLEKSVERLRTRRREAEERATKAEAEVERLREKARIEGEAGAGKSGRTTRPAGQPGCQSRPEPVPPHPSEEREARDERCPH